MLRIKGAIILGGLLVSALLSALFALLVLAQGTPALPHDFFGAVTSGGMPAVNGLEITVKAFDDSLQQVVNTDLTPDSLNDEGRHPTTGGKYSNFKVFHVANVDDSRVERGASPGEEISFFVASDTDGDQAITDADQELAAQAILTFVESGDVTTSVEFQAGDATNLDLSIFGPPQDIDVTPKTNGNTTNVSRPIFTWSPPSTGIVESYDVRILAQGSAGDGFVNIGDSPFQPTGDLTDGNFIFQVRAIGSGNRKDAVGFLSFSVTTEPSMGPPILLSPIDDVVVTGDTPLLVWAAPTTGDPVSYQVQVINSGDSFSNVPLLINEQVLAPTTEFQVTEGNPLDVGEFQWRVIADDGSIQTISDVGSFIIEIVGLGRPKPVFPLAGDPPLNDPRPFFQWTAPITGNPDFYRLQVVNTGDPFQAPFVVNKKVEHTPGVDAYQTRPNSDLADGEYEWRVRVVDLEGAGKSSREESFLLDTAAPLAPENLSRETTGDNFTDSFTWIPSVDPATADKVAGVSFYEISIPGAPVPVSSADASTICGDTLCEFPLNQLLTPGQYTVSVKAIDFATNIGAPANFGFQEGPKDVVQGLTQLPPLFVNEPLFQWNPPSELPDGGIKTYQVRFFGPDIDNIAFTSFDDDRFEVACFDSDGLLIATGANCTLAVAPDDDIRLTLLGPVPNGTHRIAVRWVDDFDEPGPSVSRQFIVESIVDLDLNLLRNGVISESDFFIAAGGSFKLAVSVNLEDPNRPEGPQPIDALDTYLNFDAGSLQVENIERIFVGQIITADNAAGTIDFEPLSFDPPLNGNFVLAVVTFRSTEFADGADPQIISPITFNNSGLRDSDVRFLGASVNRDTNGAQVTILDPVVDFRLGLQQADDNDPRFSDFLPFGFARNEVFQVPIRVETNGQSVSSVDILLDFDPTRLEVLEIQSNNDDLDTLIQRRFNNDLGTVDFSAVALGEAPTNNFTPVVVTFRAIRASQALSIGFHQEFPRNTEASLQGTAVLDELIGYPLEIALELRLRSEGSFTADVPIQIRRNGNLIDAVDVFLDSDGDVNLTNFAPVPGTVVLTPDALDKAAGTVDFGAALPGSTGIFDFGLALLVVTGDVLARSDSTFQPGIIEFQTSFPRKTQVAFEGSPIEDAVLTPVTGLEMRAVQPDGLENLRIFTLPIDNTPAFQWDPPIVAPVAGIKTFRVTIVSGDDAVDGFDSRDVSPEILCFNLAGSSVDCFVANGFPNDVFDLDRVAWVRYTVPDSLALVDGEYSLSVAAEDNLGQLGQATQLSDNFIIDLAAPSVPVLAGVLARDDAFTNVASPDLEWDPSVDNFTPVDELTYDVRVARTRTGLEGSPIRTVAGTTDTRTDLEPDLLNWWQVRAVDTAGRAQATGPVIGDSGEQSVSIPGRGNASDFTDPVRFTIDLELPTAPSDIRRDSDSAGNDPTPVFTWVRSTDNFEVLFYDVAISRLAIGSGDITGTVQDSNCDPITNLCSFTVSNADAMGLAENGLHEITVTAYDRTVDTVGRANANKAVGESGFIFDSVPPQAPENVGLVGQPPGEVGFDVTFGWDPSEDPTDITTDVSGVDFYNVELRTFDGSVVAQDTVPQGDCDLGLPQFPCRFTVQGLGDGLYDFEVGAVDVATNVGLSESATGLAVGAGDAPQNLRQQEDSRFKNTPVFEWNEPRQAPVLGIGTYLIASGDATGDFADADFIHDFTNTDLFECLENGDVVVCDPDASSFSLQFINPRPDGNFKVGVRVQDAGVIPALQPAAVVPFDVDTTAPGAPADLVVGPAIDADVASIVRVVTGDRTPTFDWQPSSGDIVSGFAGYELLMTGERTGNPLIFEIEGINTTTFTIPVEDSLPDDRYPAELVAVDVAGNRSAPAELLFIMDLDAPSAPGDLRKLSDNNDLSPEFEWNPSIDAGVGVDFNQIHIESVELTDVTAPQIPVPQTPVASGDLAITDDTTPTLSWSTVTDPDDHGVYYHLQVSLFDAIGADGELIGPFLDIDGLSFTDTSFTFLEALTLLEQFGFFWHIQAVDGEGNASGFSPLQSVIITNIVDTRQTVSTPLFPFTPSTGGDTTPTLAWTPVKDGAFSGAVSYLLEIANASGDLESATSLFGTGDVVLTADVPDDIVAFGPSQVPSIQFTLADADALVQGDYVWRVKARDANGTSGDHSAIAAFRVSLISPTPPVPGLIGPADNDIITGDRGNRIIFSWNPGIQTEDFESADLVTYTLQVSTDSGDSFTDNIVFQAPGLSVTQARRDVGFDDGQFHWRVLAINSIERTSTSEERSFSLDTTGPAATTFPEDPDRAVPPFVASGQGFYNPTIIWTEVAGTEFFELTLVSLNRIFSGDESEPGFKVQTIEFEGTADAGSPSITIPGPGVTFGSHHVLQIVGVDDLGNRGPAANLYFLDAVTGDGTSAAPNFDLNPADALIPGRYRVEVAAVDKLAAILPTEAEKLAHSSIPATLSCRATSSAVICGLAIVFEPDTASFTTSANAVRNLEIRIDPQGIEEIDGAIISIDVQGPLVSASVLITGDGVTLSAITGDGNTINFVASFDATDSEIIVATIGINTPTAVNPTEENVVFVNSGDRKTVARFLGADRPVSPLNATITVRSPAPPPPPPNQLPIANAGPAQTLDEGEVVTLDGSASSDPEGAPLTFLWTQTDGTAVVLSDATSATPTFDALDNGVFTFQLVVNDGSRDSLVGPLSTVIITVNNLAPSVDAGIDVRVDVTAADTEAVANVEVTFTDPGTLDTHRATIDWGDGTVIETEDPATSPLSLTHTYTGLDFSQIATTVFDVEVTVIDDDGDSGTDSVTVIISTEENPSPIAAFEFTPDDPAEASTVSFNAGASNDPNPEGFIVNYAWDFGDGSPIEEGAGLAFTSHIFVDNGDFQVTLLVTDNEGATGDITITVPVSNVVPIVTAGEDQTAVEGDTVTINPTFVYVSAADTHVMTIDWGDRSPGEIIDPAQSPESATHIYRDNDRFTVTVTVTDDDEGSSSDDLVVTVSNVPPVVVAGPDQVAFVGDLVTVDADFTDGGAGDAHTATVDWGDGPPPERATVTEAGGQGTVQATHIYLTENTFEVTITVTDDDQGVSSDTLQVVTLIPADISQGLVASELSLSPEDPGPGDPVTAFFRVTNETDIPIEGTLDLLVDGEIHETIAVSLAGGASRILSNSAAFPILVTEPGIHPIQVGSEVVAITIEEARLVLSDAIVAPVSVAIGDVVVISVEASNDGDVVGQFAISIGVSTDGVPSTEVQTITLVPGVPQTIVRFVTIDDTLTGVSSFGRHDVVIEGQRNLFYRVVPPVLDTPVPTTHQFNPDTTQVRDASGNLLRVNLLQPEIVFGAGSITLSIPVLAPREVAVTSFVDTESGISITGRDVEVPIRDPNTGETLLTLVGVLNDELRGNEAEDAATSTFVQLRLLTVQQREDLSADNPSVGTLGVSLNAELDSFPENSNIEMTIKSQLSDEDRVLVEVAALGEDPNQPKIVADEAGTIIVNAGALSESGAVGAVEISVTVGLDWINQFGSNNVRVAHTFTDEDGIERVELLEAVCEELSFEAFQAGELTCTAVTQNGFSDFTFLAVAVKPQFTATNLVISPEVAEPGEAVTISVDILNTSTRTSPFSATLKLGEFDSDDPPVAIAVKSITLGPRETGTIRFFVPTEIQGRFVVEIEGEIGDFNVFRKLTDIDFGSELTIDPDPARPGQLVNIGMTITNNGDLRGQAEVEFRVNGVLLELRSSTIDAGETFLVNFEFIPPGAGCYAIEIVDTSGDVAPLIGEFCAEFEVGEAEPDIFNLQISPLETLPGEIVTINILASNDGDVAGDVIIVVQVDGVTEVQETITLEELSFVPVELSLVAPQADGTHTITVFGTDLDGNPVTSILEGTFVVRSPEVPFVRIVSLEADPPQVFTGELVIVRVVVDNPSEGEATRSFTLTLDGEIIEEFTVTLAPGDEQTLSFDITDAEVGTHTVALDIFEDTFTVEERPEPPVPADLVLSPNLIISPSQVEPNEQVTIEAFITNNGGTAGTATAVLSINGVQRGASQQVTVAPGVTATVTFTVTEAEDGIYAVQVAAADGTASGSFTVTAVVIIEPPPIEPPEEVGPDINIVPGSLIADPAIATSGEVVTVTVDLRNDGDEAGTIALVFKLDGENVEEREIPVEAGETVSVTFDPFVVRSSGIHTIEVNEVTAEFEITRPASLGLIIPLILIFGLLVASLAFLLYTRAKRGGQPAGA